MVNLFCVYIFNSSVDLWELEKYGIQYLVSSVYSTGTGNLNRGHSRLPFRQKDGVRLCASEPGTRIVSGGRGGGDYSTHLRNGTEPSLEKAVQRICLVPWQKKVIKVSTDMEWKRQGTLKKNKLKYHQTSFADEPLKSFPTVLTFVWKNGADPPGTPPQNDGCPSAFC